MNRLKRIVIVASACISVAAISDYVPVILEERAMQKMPSGLYEFKLSDPPPQCEKWKNNMPKIRDPIPYRQYMAARAIWRTKIEWQLTRVEANNILQGVREAAEKGDWGARALMARFYLRGLGVLESNRVLNPEPEKAVEIIREAAKLEQPWGLYDLGVAYQHGYGGVPQSGKIAWAYFFKAAARGSPEAQMALADAYGDARKFEYQEAMWLCAYEQQHGPAASAFGIYQRAVVEDYMTAIKYFQAGVEFGDFDSAVALQQIYEEGYWSHIGLEERPKFEALGIKMDLERSRRYGIIAAALQVNPDLKLTRLNEVLPLPPAKLPSWNGILDAVESESNAPPTY
jgi:hypothetical protein